MRTSEQDAIAERGGSLGVNVSNIDFNVGRRHVGFKNIVLRAISLNQSGEHKDEMDGDGRRGGDLGGVWSRQTLFR